jgi:hypothetical protein
MRHAFVTMLGTVILSICVMSVSGFAFGPGENFSVIPDGEGDDVLLKEASDGSKRVLFREVPVNGVVDVATDDTPISLYLYVSNGYNYACTTRRPTQHFLPLVIPDMAATKI